MDEITDLVAVILALPANVWVDALKVFIVLALLKGAGIVPKGNWSRVINALLTASFAGLTVSTLTLSLETAATATIAAWYYHLWKTYISIWLAPKWEQLKAAITPG